MFSAFVEQIRGVVFLNIAFVFMVQLQQSWV